MSLFRRQNISVTVSAQSRGFFFWLRDVLDTGQTVYEQFLCHRCSSFLLGLFHLVADLFELGVELLHGPFDLLFGLLRIHQCLDVVSDELFDLRRSLFVERVELVGDFLSPDQVVEHGLEHLQKPPVRATVPVYLISVAQSREVVFEAFAPFVERLEGDWVRQISYRLVLGRDTTSSVLCPCS